MILLGIVQPDHLPAHQLKTASECHFLPMSEHQQVSHYCAGLQFPAGHILAHVLTASPAADALRILAMVLHNIGDTPKCEGCFWAEYAFTIAGLSS